MRSATEIAPIINFDEKVPAQDVKGITVTAQPDICRSGSVLFPVMAVCFVAGLNHE